MQMALQLAFGHLMMESPWYFLACVPFVHSLRIPKSHMYGRMVGVTVVRFISDILLVLLVPDWLSYTWIQYIIYYIVLAVVFFTAFRIPISKLVYVYMLVNSISSLINHTATHSLILLFPNEKVSVTTFLPYSIVIAIMNALAFPFLLHFFRGRLREAMEQLDAKITRLLCVPLALFSALSLLYTLLLETRGPENVPYAIIFLFILTAELITYYINLRLVMDSTNRARKDMEIEKQLALQAQGYESLTQNIENARAARHDLRHHLNVIRAFAAQKDDDGLMAYLDEYAAALPIDTSAVYCENRVVNALLSHYLTLASEAGVEIDVKMDLPPDAGVANADLCIIFGNIFENASKSAAHAPDRKFIFARCEAKPGDIALVMENSIGVGVEKGSGIGLNSVQAIAKKYGGYARFHQEAAVFHSTVFLHRPLPKQGK